MNYRIEHRPAFSVMGVKRFISFKEGSSGFGKFWNEVRQGEAGERLKTYKNDTIDGMLSITLKSNKDDTKVTSMLGYTTNELTPQEEFEIYHYPAASWMVIEVIGRPSKAMRPVWKAIYEGEYKPEGFTKSDLPPFEAYIDDDLSSENSKNEIWLGLKNN
ncbi:GyrI-like domain-containing protein [Aerococcaceae bacterium WGS1372]